MYSLLLTESHPLNLHKTIQIHGIRFAYWNLRQYGASRYQAIRAILFAI
jgi:hypothetical protein